MTSFDALIQYLLEEIACDGTEGTDPSRLSTSIQKYFSQSGQHQLLDSSFVEFVWNTLVSLDEVTVGVSSKPARGGKDQEPPIPLELPITPLRELQLLHPPPASLRLSVSEAESWLALTGSHAKPSKLTPIVWMVIQRVARAREDGITMMEACKELGLDPRSAFHFIRSGVELGVLKKFEAVYQGARTSRLLHLRYLAGSRAWREHTQKENYDQEDEGVKGEDDEEGGDGSMFLSGGMSAISRSYLISNVPLIKNRIIRAVREAKGNLVHSEVGRTIGLVSQVLNDTRKIREIIKQLCDDGILVKTLSQHPDSIRSVLLLGLAENQSRSDGKKKEVEIDELDGEEDEAQEDDDAEEDVELPHAQIWVSIERQVLDLLQEAGPAGLRNADLSSALGSYTTRFIDQLLTRLSRVEPPSHLSDQSIVPLTETFGREKRTRWFSRCGYLERCARNGMENNEGDEQKDDEDDDGALLGGFAEEENRGFYRDLEERTAVWKKIDIGRGWKKALRENREDNSDSGGTKKVKQTDGRGQGKKRSREEDGKANGEPPSPPKTKGRPRKKPKVEGVLTYYERRKLEDLERIKLGLPPRQKGQKKVDLEEVKVEEEEEEETGIEKGKEAAKVERAAKRRKSSVRFDVPQEEKEDDVGVGVDVDMDVDVTTKTKGKKKGKGKGKEKEESSSSSTAPTGSIKKKTVDFVVGPFLIRKKTVDFVVGPFLTKKKKPTGVVRPTSVSPSNISPPGVALSSLPTLSVSASGAPVSKAITANVSASPAGAPFELEDSPMKFLADHPRLPESTLALPPLSSAPIPDISHSLPSLPVAVVASKAPKQSKSRKDVDCDVPNDDSLPAPNMNLPPLSNAVQPPKKPQSKAKNPRKPKVAQSTVPESRSLLLPSTSSSFRPVVPPKFNLTALQRQADVLAYVEANGGIVERENRNRFPRTIKAFLEQRDPDKPTFMMDRVVLDQTVDDLVRRGSCKTTVIQVGALAKTRIEILFLASIELDSPEMIEYIEKLSLTALPKKVGMNLATQLALVDGVNKERAHGRRNQPPDLPASNERQLIRAFFRKERNVAGASNGCLYGRFARAKELHAAIAKILFGSEGHLSASGTRIFPTTLLTARLPLGVVLRTSPNGDTSSEFKAFIAAKEHLELPIQELPTWVRQAVGILDIHTKRTQRKVLTSLIRLGLLTPLAEVNVGAQPLELQPVGRPAFATFWEFKTSAPLYAFATPDKQLLAVLPLETPGEVAHYWEALHAASIPGTADVDLDHALPGHHEFSLAFDPAEKDISNTITSTTKWRDTFMLLQSQRAHLSNLVQDGFVPRKASPAQLLEIADDILAPIEAVREFYSQSAVKIKVSLTRKRRKLDHNSTQLSDAGGSSPHSTRGLKASVEPTPKSRGEMAAALQKKAAEAVERRVHDWQALKDRFSKANGDIVLEGPVVDYLHKRFTKPRAGSKAIDANDLEQELRLLLPPPSAAELLTEPINMYRSIVPPSILSKARAANDPYALPRPPRMERTRKPSKKRGPKPSSEVAPPLFPAEPGTQLEFLSTAPRPVPALQKGQRLPRGFITEEQVDLIMDAVAVINARNEYLGARTVFTALGLLFPEMPLAKVRTQFVRMVAKPEEKIYHARLTEAWKEVWNAKRGDPELPDPHPKSATDFDIAACIRCLRANVDKKALRLAGDPLPVKAREQLPPLPATLAELNDTYRVTDLGSKFERSSQWAGVFKGTMTMVTREVESTSLPISMPCWEPDVENDDGSFAVTSLLKMVLVTPEASHDEAEAHAFLLPFQEQLEPAVTRLMSDGVITRYHSEESRRAPGRNFALAPKFIDAFDDILDARRVRDAEKLEGKLKSGTAENLWPIIVESGEMMALVDLVSSDKINLTIDLSTTAHSRDPTDYQTKKIDDYCIENSIYIDATSSIEDDSPLFTGLPSPFPPLNSTDDPDRLGMTLAFVGQQLRDTSIHTTYEALLYAGSSGLSLSSLRSLLPSLDEFTLTQQIQAFLTWSPPLVFWAGARLPVLVASHDLSSWAASTRDLGSVTGERRFTFPTIWVDVNGEVVPNLWQKSSGWVMSLLMHSPGLTCLQIHERSQKVCGGLLTLVEIILILSTLRERGSAVSVTTGEVAAGLLEAQGGALVDWEVSRWFLA